MLNPCRASETHCAFRVAPVLREAPARSAADVYRGDSISTIRGPAATGWIPAGEPTGGKPNPSGTRSQMREHTQAGGGSLRRRRPLTPDQNRSSSDLPTRRGAPARRALLAAGFTRLEQLSAASEEDLERLHGMGPPTMEYIRDALREAGLGPPTRAADGGSE
jgi:hypothetical protein